MDRRLVGILAIAAILSTLVSIGIFQRKEEEPVRFAVNTFPENLPWAGYGRPRFVADIVATTELPDLIVEYSILKRVRPVLADPWNQTSLPAENLASNILLLENTRAWIERCRRDGLEVSVKEREVPVRVNGSDAVLYVYDYTDVFKTFGLGPGQLNTTETVWGLLVDASGNVSTYAGIRDFFFDRLRIMHSLEVFDKTGKESYASKRMLPELRGGRPGIDAAPAMGTLHRRGLSEGDRVHIFFDLMAERMFRHEGFIQLIVTRTGFGETVRANIMGASTI